MKVEALEWSKTNTFDFDDNSRKEGEELIKELYQRGAKLVELDTAVPETLIVTLDFSRSAADLEEVIEELDDLEDETRLSVVWEDKSYELVKQARAGSRKAVEDFLNSKKV